MAEKTKDEVAAPPSLGSPLRHPVPVAASALSLPRAVPLLRRVFLGQPRIAERVILVFLFVVLISSRLPNVLLSGRVWAEEGKCFMQDAMVLPWAQALFHSVGGYLNIIANLAGIVAVYGVSLEHARFVGPTVGLLFQSLPAILIVSSKLRWLRGRTALVAALLVVGTVPLAEEVWLNSLHPQFHLALCAALILAMPAVRGWPGRLHLVLVGLAALCGPTAWLLLPLFTARALSDRSRARARQSAVLAACVLIQVIFFHQAGSGGDFAPDIGGVGSIIVVKHLLVPAFDYRTASAISDSLLGMAQNHVVPIAIIAAETTGCAIISMALWLRSPRELFWMFASAVIMAVPSYVAARGGSLMALSITSGNRYAFAPQILLELSVLGVAMTSTETARLLARLGVSWWLVVGIAELRSSPSLGMFADGPSWVEEVAAWRQDHTHIARIWPGPWTVDLNLLPASRR